MRTCINQEGRRAPPPQNDSKENQNTSSKDCWLFASWDIIKRPSILPRAHLYAGCLNFLSGVGRLADAHDAHHVLLLELFYVQVQVVVLGSVHDDESELLPLHQRRVGRHGRRLDPAYGRIGRRGPSRQNDKHKKECRKNAIS